VLAEDFGAKHEPTAIEDQTGFPTPVRVVWTVRPCARSAAGSTLAGAMFASIACRLDRTGAIGKLCQTVDSKGN
jgi:hypothetical protein